MGRTKKETLLAYAVYSEASPVMLNGAHSEQICRRKRERQKEHLWTRGKGEMRETVKEKKKGEHNL